jgi:hypothetical protein
MGKEIQVNNLINLLLEAKARGSKTVVLEGKILTGPGPNGNTIIISS